MHRDAYLESRNKPYYELDERSLPLKIYSLLLEAVVLPMLTGSLFETRL